MKYLITFLLFFIIIACDKEQNKPVPSPSVSPQVSPTPSPSPEPEKDEPHKYKTGFKKEGPGLSKELDFEIPENLFEIPKSFDWRKMVDVPIQNQGNCGSCWAFSTIAALDFASQIYGMGEKYSEQELVDCSNYYGCDGGYFAGSWILKNGIALEKDYPYVAYDQKCKSSPEINVGKIKSWKNVGNPNRKPTIVELKQAVLQHGAVSVDVAATANWDDYSGGVKSGCGGTNINHMVAIIGWTKEGNWIVRNSWGTKWGDGGYAIMPPNCDSIATDAAFLTIETGRK